MNNSEGKKIQQYIDKESMEVMRTFVDMVKQGRGLPDKVTTEQAVLMLQTGVELGIPPAKALRSFYVVNNRVAMLATAMMDLVRQHPTIYGGAEHYWFGDDDILHDVNEERPRPGDFQGWATCFHRKDTGETYTAYFTRADAQRAKLDKKDNWMNYTMPMCKARCISDGLRTLFADLLGAIYTPDEIAGGLNVDEPAYIVDMQIAEGEDSEERAGEPEVAEEESPHEQLISDIHMAAVAANVSQAKRDSDIKQRINVGGDAEEALTDLLGFYEAEAIEQPAKQVVNDIVEQLEKPVEKQIAAGEVKRLDEPEQGALIE